MKSKLLQKKNPLYDLISFFLVVVSFILWLDSVFRFSTSAK